MGVDAAEKAEARALSSGFSAPWRGNAGQKEREPQVGSKEATPEGIAKDTPAYV